MSKTRIFQKNRRFSIFGQSPISPTPDVKVHFNSSREDLKNAYLRSSLSASVLTKFEKNTFWGFGHPPTGYTPDNLKFHTDWNYSPSATIEWKISKIVLGNFAQIDFLHLKTCNFDPVYKIASVCKSLRSIPTLTNVNFGIFLYTIRDVASRKHETYLCQYN